MMTPGQGKSHQFIQSAAGCGARLQPPAGHAHRPGETELPANSMLNAIDGPAVSADTRRSVIPLSIIGSEGATC